MHYMADGCLEGYSRRKANSYVNSNPCCCCGCAVLDSHWYEDIVLQMADLTSPSGLPTLHVLKHSLGIDFESSMYGRGDRLISSD